MTDATRLGWKKPAPDSRDYPLKVFLGTATPLQAAYANLLKSTANKYVKLWATEVERVLEGSPQPSPTPTPKPVPTSSILWADSDNVLDQGNTGHCVGFGGAQWGNTLPVDDHFSNDDGHQIYYECKVIDGEPKQEDGSSVHSLAKDLQSRGKLKTYAWASSTSEITKFIQTQGPVTVGTDWYNDMFNPDSAGFVKPTGGIAGGHCYNLVGWTNEALGEYYVGLNSWGNTWAQKGYFKILVSDFAKLLAAQGEAMAAVEL